METTEQNVQTEATETEAKTGKKEKERDPNVTIGVQGRVKQMKCHDIDWAAKWNVRDESLYPARVARKVSELLQDKYIRTPLVACKIIGSADDAPLVGACGFVRSRAIANIREKHPDVYRECFSTVPIMVIECTERERQLLMMDHGSEEPLNLYEAYLATKKMFKQNIWTQEEIAATLHTLYFQLANNQTRVEYEEKLDELRREGVVLKGSTKIKTESKLQLATWRGRIQFFQRIMNSPACVEKAFRAFILREAGGVKITYKMAEELDGSKEEDAQKYLDAIRAQKEEKSSGEKKEDTKGSPQFWGAAKLKSARAACRSHFLKTQLDAACGDNEAAKRIPDEEDQLIRWETAHKLEPERFDAMVEEILAAHMES